MDEQNYVPPQPWEIEMVVWSPDRPWGENSGFRGLLGLLSQRAAAGWEFVSVVRDLPDAGPCWIFKRRTALFDDVADALATSVQTAGALPRTYGREFSLTYRAGVTADADAWSCTFGAEVGGDRDQFVVMGPTPAEVLRRASEDAWRRVPPAP